MNFHDGSDEPAEPRSCLRGCLVGCGGVLALGLVLILGLWFWLARAGSQRPTAAVASERSVAVIRFAPGDDDPGVEAVRRALEEAVDANLREASAPIRASVAGILGALLPTEVTVSYEPLPGLDDPVAVTAFNPGGYTRLLRLFVTGMSGEGDRPTRRDVELMEWPDGRHWAFVGGTGITSEESYAVVQAIDRLQEVEDAGPFGGAELPSVPDGPWDLTGSYRDPSVLARELRDDDEEDPAVRELIAALDSADAVTFGVDFEGPDRTSGTVRAVAGSEPEAQALAEEFRRAFAGAAGVDASLTVRVTGASVEGDLRAAGLVEWFSRPASEP